MSDAGIAAAKAANPSLYRAMIRIREAAETLPDPGDIFRQQSWKQMAPIVQDALLEYNDAFANEVGQALEAQLPDQLATQERQLMNAGVKVQPDQFGSAVSTINPAQIKVGDKPLSKWFTSSDGKPPLWAKSNWDTINKAVTRGIFEGKSTQAIAESLIPEDVRAGLGGFTLRGDSEGAKIYRQAQQMAKSAIQQQNIDLNQQLWEQNKEALEGYGLVWEWVATLDSRVCPICSPLDGRREEDQSGFGVLPLVHIGCRCQVIQVRPDDEPRTRNGQEISDKPFKYKGKTLDQMNKAERQEALSTGGLYASKIRINGKMYYRRSISTKGDGYAGWLAETNDATKHQFFGSRKRVKYFNDQLAKGRNPREIFNEMLKGEKGDTSWVPNLKGVGAPPKTLKAKPAAKPSVKTKATVAAEAKVKANREKTEALFKQQAAEAKPKPKPKAKPKPVAAAPAPAPAPKPKPAPKKTVAPPKQEIRQWTANGYKEMRAEEFRQAQAAGVKLNAYEKEQIKAFPRNDRTVKATKAVEAYVESDAARYKGTVYRGMNLEQAELDDLLKRYESGGKALAMESWTKNPDLSDFTIGGANPVKLRIVNKHGVDIEPFSGIKEEREVLMPKNVRYRIKNVEKAEFSPSATKRGFYSYEIELEQLDD